MPRGPIAFIHKAMSLPNHLPFTPHALRICLSYSTNMSDLIFGPPLDASGVLTWRLLHFLAGQLPSAQEKRGDRRLVKALQLATDDEAIISPGDMAVVKDKIIL